MRQWLVIIGLVLIAGCGMNPPPVGESVSVNGKVNGSDGKPVGGMTLNIQPLENGYAKAVEVKADGTFALETQPGKYAYFFTAKSGAKSVPTEVAKLTEANMERTVVISGPELSIKLP